MFSWRIAVFEISSMASLNGCDRLYCRLVCKHVPVIAIRPPDYIILLTFPNLVRSTHSKNPQHRRSKFCRRAALKREFLVPWHE